MRIGMMKDCVVRRAARYVNSGALSEGSALGQFVQLRFKSLRVFRIRSGDRMPHIDAITRLELCDALADGLDHARSFAAWHVGQLWLDCIGPRAHVRVKRVYARRMDADHG